jgi:hypothetical protein
VKGVEEEGEWILRAQRGSVPGGVRACISVIVPRAHHISALCPVILGRLKQDFTAVEFCKILDFLDPMGRQTTSVLPVKWSQE